MQPTFPIPDTSHHHLPSLWEIVLLEVSESAIAQQNEASE